MMELYVFLLMTAFHRKVHLSRNNLNLKQRILTQYFQTHVYKLYIIHRRCSESGFSSRNIRKKKLREKALSSLFEVKQFTENVLQQLPVRADHLRMSVGESIGD